MSLAAATPPLAIGAAGAVASLFAPPWLAMLMGVGFDLMLLDAISRMREYRRVKSVIERFGTSNPAAQQTLAGMRRSWCQRHAAITAARHAGAEHWARGFYKHCGYRWWHIFPDHTFGRHSPFLNVRFWRSIIAGR